jgi:hypothetical protein
MSSSKPVVPSSTNPELQAESEAAKPKRELYTPKPKQAEVIKRHLNGESDRKIAREENIDRATVARILTEPELLTLRKEDCGARTMTQKRGTSGRWMRFGISWG